MRGAFAGTLAERIAIERRGEARDDVGGAEGDWALLTTCWAAIGLDGSGAEASGDVLSRMPRWRVTVRSGVAPGPGDRINWKGRLLAVRRVEADPRTPDRLVIMAEEMRG